MAVKCHNTPGLPGEALNETLDYPVLASRDRAPRKCGRPVGYASSEAERAKISASLANWNCAPEARLRGVARAMTLREAEDYRLLREARFSCSEALTAIGRPDLLHYRPTPLPPQLIYARLAPAEKHALWRVWDQATGWEHALRLIGWRRQPRVPAWVRRGAGRRAK